MTTATAEKPAKTRAKPVLTLGAASDRIWQLREDKRALDKQVKTIEDEIKLLTEDIFEMLEKQDTRKAEGKRASVSVNYAVVSNTVDWEDTIKFIVAGKRGDKMAYAHLLQHRISEPAYRELRALGMVIPGQQDFTKRTLSITSLNV